MRIQRHTALLHQSYTDIFDKRNVNIALIKYTQSGNLLNSGSSVDSVCHDMSSFKIKYDILVIILVPFGVHQNLLLVLTCILMHVVLSHGEIT